MHISSSPLLAVHQHRIEFFRIQIEHLGLTVPPALPDALQDGFQESTVQALAAGMSIDNQRIHFDPSIYLSNDNFHFTSILGLC
ncbi:hypothetical protein D3C71_1897470 [compost metagenome]